MYNNNNVDLLLALTQEREKTCERYIHAPREERKRAKARHTVHMYMYEEERKAKERKRHQETKIYKKGVN